MEGIRAERELSRKREAKTKTFFDLTQRKGSKADFTARNITAHSRGTTFPLQGAFIFICLDCRATSSIPEAKFLSSVV